MDPPPPVAESFSSIIRTVRAFLARRTDRAVEGRGERVGLEWRANVFFLYKNQGFHIDFKPTCLSSTLEHRWNRRHFSFHFDVGLKLTSFEFSIVV